MQEQTAAEITPVRFNRLVQDLLGGRLQRNCFQRWEIDLMLEIEGCQLRESAKRQVLRRYQKAVNRQFERGGGRPYSLTEYLEQRRPRSARG